MADGYVHQINISTSGVPKLPVPTATVTELGLVGDGHAEAGHGGVDKALCLYSLEVIESFAAEGHSLFPGAAGENITTRGLDWSAVVPGTRLWLGEQVLIEVTTYPTPCKKIARWFSDGNFARLSQKISPGRVRVYAKVLSGGALTTGDPIRFAAASPHSG